MSKTFIIAMLMAIPVFFGCNKKSEHPKQSPAYKSLDFTKIDLGKAHNDAVRVILGKVEKQPGSRLTAQNEELIETLINAAKTIPLNCTASDFATLGITQDDFYEWISYMSNELAFYGYDVNNYPNNNPVVLRYTNEIISAVNSGITLEEIDNAVDQVQSKANSELEGFNLDIVTGTIQISKSSARLWAPVELGGEGLSPYGANFRVTGGGWRGALIGDISGSAQYFMGLGAACALGWAPGANVVILGGWAISAGLSSACGALGVHCAGLPPKPKDIQPVPPSPELENF